MGKCSVKLPEGTSADELNATLGNYIKQIGALGDSMLAMAAREFFEATTRWRYVDYNIELEAGDQQIDFELPDGVKARARAPVFMRYERCPHDQCDEIKVYERKDGAQADLDNTAFNQCYSHGKPRSFHQPVNGKIILDRPIECDSMFRIELILWPYTFEGIECVPEEIMSTYQEGIVSLAITKAMEIPDKPWTMPKDGYSPNMFAGIHKQKAEDHKKSARNYHRNNVGEGRPFGDRFRSRTSSNGRHGSRYNYSHRNRLHKW